MIPIRALLLLGAAALPSVSAAQASDGIYAANILPDQEFYRLVACAAPPSKPCTRPFVRWPQDQAAALTIGFVGRDEKYPTELLAETDAALQAAIDQVNRLEAAVRLVRDDNDPNIKIVLKNLGEGARLRRTGIPGMNRGRINGAMVRIWWNASREITRAAIVITPVIRKDSLRSVVLEETVQALGFLRDVEGPAYQHKSIFSQHDNSTTTLRGQDAMALRQHYRN